MAGDAHRLPHLGDRALEPRIRWQEAARQPHHAEDVPQHTGDNQNRQRHEPSQHHPHVDGRDRGHHQEVHGGAREALHETMVERIARGEVGEEELHHQATDHAQWKEWKTVEEGAAVGARRPHQELNAHQAAVDQIADEGHRDR